MGGYAWELMAPREKYGRKHDKGARLRPAVNQGKQEIQIMEVSGPKSSAYFSSPLYSDVD